jgi:hypothetical protein
MFGEYASHNILVDLDTEYEGDLLSDAPAAEARVPPFHFDDRCNQFWARPFRAALASPSWRKEQAVFAIHVDGFSTMAERSRRAGRIRPAQRLAMMRSIGLRFGALARDRLRISS